MTDQQPRPAGQTRDAGWEIGARRTLPVEAEQLWALLVAPEGRRLWLGETPGLELAQGAAYRLDDGTSGRVTVFKPGSHMRLTWHPPGWPRPSIIQVRALPSKAGAVLAFHQEHLPGPGEREATAIVNTALTGR
jgi:uncharacterized protein YndB with AHSA1/START domain